MSIGFESMEEVKDAVQEVPEIAEQPKIDEFPPKLERAGEAGEVGEMPPKLERNGKLGEMTLGESVEHQAARHRLENAIKDGNKIAIEHRKADLAKIEAKEMMKK